MSTFFAELFAFLNSTLYLVFSKCFVEPIQGVCIAVFEEALNDIFRMFLLKRLSVTIPEIFPKLLWNTHISIIPHLCDHAYIIHNLQLLIRRARCSICVPVRLGIFTQRSQTIRRAWFKKVLHPVHQRWLMHLFIKQFLPVIIGKYAIT